jgi:hypothetical protein
MRVALGLAILWSFGFVPQDAAPIDNLQKRIDEVRRKFNVSGAQVA